MGRMLGPLTTFALVDAIGDLLMVGLAVVFFALMWLTIEFLDRV